MVLIAAKSIFISLDLFLFLRYNIPICFLPDFQYHNELNHQVLALIHRFIKSIRSKNILFVIDQVKIDTEIFKVMGAENESCLYFASSEKIESCDKVTKLFNFYLPLDLNEFKDTALIYIGPHEKLAVDFGCIFFNFESLCIDSKNNLCFNASISRELAKRSKLIDSISCFDHVGILVENPNVKLHVDTAQYIQNMCASNDIIADIIYVGRLNEMKIGNFPDIEFFIHLSCSGRSSFSFIKPIVSPLEFICAKFNLDFWNNQHLRDFESFLAFCDSNKEIFLKNYSEDIDLNGKLVIKSFHELSTQLLSTRKNYSYTGLQISPSFQEMRLHKGANGNSTYYDYESN